MTAVSNTRKFRRPLTALAALVGALSLSLGLAACGSSTGSSTSTGKAANSLTQQTLNPGTLTVATGNPAYEPWVVGNKPESGKGYEAALTYAVAAKLGFSKNQVKWIRTDFDAAIAPGPKDFDLNIQQFTDTPARRKAVDFSSSYYNDSDSLVVKKGSKYASASSLNDLKNATIAVMVGTPAYEQAKKFNSHVETFNDDASAAAALSAGQVDAWATSTVNCVYAVQSGEVKQAEVLGRIANSTEPDGLGIVLPKGSALTKAVSQAIDELKADGTLTKLQDKWLAEYTTGVKVLK